MPSFQKLMAEQGKGAQKPALPKDGGL
jgi:hypothetical protein